MGGQYISPVESLAWRTVAAVPLLLKSVKHAVTGSPGAEHAQLTALTRHVHVKVSNPSGQLRQVVLGAWGVEASNWAVQAHTGPSTVYPTVAGSGPHAADLPLHVTVASLPGLLGFNNVTMSPPVGLAMLTSTALRKVTRESNSADSLKRKAPGALPDPPIPEAVLPCAQRGPSKLTVDPLANRAPPLASAVLLVNVVGPKNLTSEERQ